MLNHLGRGAYIYIYIYIYIYARIIKYHGIWSNLFEQLNLVFKCFLVDAAYFVAPMLLKDIRGSLNKFPDFFRMGTFIDSTHMKL